MLFQWHLSVLISLILSLAKKPEIRVRAFFMPRPPDIQFCGCDRHGTTVQESSTSNWRGLATIAGRLMMPGDASGGNGALTSSSPLSRILGHKKYSQKWIKRKREYSCGQLFCGCGEPFYSQSIGSVTFRCSLHVVNQCQTKKSSDLFFYRFVFVLDRISIAAAAAAAVRISCVRRWRMLCVRLRNSRSITKRVLKKLWRTCLA